MANDTLRAALHHAGLTADDLARIVQVDVRTVRRWLSGTTPYPRQRGKVARALDVPEHDLWPDTPAASPRPPAAQRRETVAAYPFASDPVAPDPVALMREAAARIELLGDTLLDTLATPGVPELLAAKATQGCAVRILIYATHEHVAPLVDHAGIEIRLLEVPARHVIHRFDDDLLLALDLIGGDPDHAPLIHVRRATSEGVFDRLAEYFSFIWEQDSEPLRPDFHLAPEEDDDEEDEDRDTDEQSSVPDAPDTGPSEPPAPPPRRWPGRGERSRSDG